MVNKKLDEKKFLVVFCGKNDQEAREQIEVMQKISFQIPEDYSLSVNSMVINENFSAAFNELQKKSDAKYKIYLTAPVKFFEKDFLMTVLNSFFISPNTGMVGFFGSEMPITGDYTKAENFYGNYSFFQDEKNVTAYTGKTPLFAKSVHMLESSFFATNVDIDWDEEVGDDFFLAAQCCKFRAEGYNISITWVQQQTLIFARNDFSYKPKVNQENYQKQLEKFQKLYKNKMVPLVSVLIPTYNQPKFFKEALESALNQTYPNIEILVGDDSTNEETKNLIQPYLKKHKNIKYFYHDGKIPRGGGDNMLFLINHCKGEFVNYLLHDDLFYPEKISKMMNYFIKDLDEKISLITSTRDAIDQNGNVIRVQSTWRPKSDEIINGIEVGRMLMFTIGNFIGELTTVIFRKRDSIVKNSVNEKIYSVGNYCGICDRVYGDLSTWLNILKNGGDFIFMTESLSAFRHHPRQNTHKSSTQLNIPVDAIDYITISWLNNLFLRDSEEYLYSCRKWTLYVQIFVNDIQEDDSKEVKKLKNEMFKLRDTILANDYAIILDCAIRFLLNRLPEDNSINDLIQKNKTTGLFEKINEGKMLRSLQK